MLKNAENIALQNSLILYTFVLRSEIYTTFTPKVVRISACKIGYIFRIFQHFASKFCNFTIFDMVFSAGVMDFFFHVLIKI